MTMQISTILTKKIQSFKSTLIPEDDPMRSIRFSRNQNNMKIELANMANKLVKGSTASVLTQAELKLKRGLKTMSKLQYDDVARTIVFKTGTKEQKDVFIKNSLKQYIMPNDQREKYRRLYKE